VVAKSPDREIRGFSILLTPQETTQRNFPKKAKSGAEKTSTRPTEGRLFRVWFWRAKSGRKMLQQLIKPAAIGPRQSATSEARLSLIWVFSPNGTQKTIHH
jgi:hypothetical protein